MCNVQFDSNVISNAIIHQNCRQDKLILICRILVKLSGEYSEGEVVVEIYNRPSVGRVSQVIRAAPALQ